MQWIDDDWATLDSDAPDVKRAKNVNEGVGLGIFLICFSAQLSCLEAVSKLEETIKKIPKSETTAGYKDFFKAF